MSLKGAWLVMSGISRVDGAVFLSELAFILQRVSHPRKARLPRGCQDQSELESDGSFDSLRWKTVKGESAIRS